MRGGAATGTTQPIERGRGPAFAVLTGWGITAVRGSDARSWLHDLVTADVEGLPDRGSRRSLLLTPTGRIRADLHIAAVDGSYLLLQAPDQPDRVDAILRPYVLSSDVEVLDVSDRSEVVAVLDGSAAEDGGPDSVVLSPSVLGPGYDVIVPPGDASVRLRDRLRARGLTEVDDGDLEARRIRRGEPRMGVDFGPDALPAEVGLEDAIDFTKGCFLGQESVAKVRNLGHPPRVLLHVCSGAPISPGARVVAGGTVVGEVTSAVEEPDGVTAIVRIRWDAASEKLATDAGPLSLQRVK
jgi:tRNA-modifying protein YgfZ